MIQRRFTVPPRRRDVVALLEEEKWYRNQTSLLMTISSSLGVSAKSPTSLTPG